MSSRLWKKTRQILLNHGCKKVREGKGSHVIWSNPTGQYETFTTTGKSRHTFNQALKRLGIEEKI